MIRSRPSYLPEGFVLNRYAIILFLSLALTAPVRTQTVRGSIGGIILDPSGKPVSIAYIQVTEQDTARQRNTASDGSGEFRVSALPPGTYRIEIDRDGFRRHVQTVVLAVNQELDLRISLVAGQRNDQVSVTASAPLTRTESAAVSGVISTRAIVGLPLDGRNFHELSLLLPGVAPAAPGSAGSVRGDFAINVNGGREDANNFLLDGVYNGDPKLNGFAVSPPVDAIREFEVLTNAYDASFGRNGGGQINVVTKSGTNQVHGAVYEFFRNAAFDARNFFAPAHEAAPKYQRNQFGGAIGAPIVKNRTFFFSDYQGRRQREGITRITNVPTLAERRGDFSQSLNPPVNPLSGQPFPGNQVPSFFQNPIGAGIAALYPLPNRNVTGQNFVSSPTLRDREDQFDVRIDHKLTDRSELYGRYSFSDRDLYDPFSGPTYSQLPGFGVNIPRRAQNAMIGNTHVFTPAFLNELRAGFDRVALSVTQQNVNNNLNAQVGLPSPQNPRDTGLSFITITGFSPIGDEGNNPQRGVTNSYEILDHATWTSGRHTLRTGFGFRSLQQNAFRDVQARGFLNFSGMLLGNGLAELLLGAPTITGVARLDNPQHLRARSYNVFLQDTWRVRSRPHSQPRPALRIQHAPVRRPRSRRPLRSR
jgi:hypothetical protein